MGYDFWVIQHLSEIKRAVRKQYLGSKFDESVDLRQSELSQIAKSLEMNYRTVIKAMSYDAEKSKGRRPDRDTFNKLAYYALGNETLTVSLYESIKKTDFVKELVESLENPEASKGVIPNVETRVKPVKPHEKILTPVEIENEIEDLSLTQVITIKELSKEGIFYSLSVQVGGHEPYEVKIKEPSMNTGFEWYFEKYISEPWMPGAPRIEENIKEYGHTLFELIFREGSKGRNLFVTKASDQLVFKIRGESNGFHAILWETLWVPSHEESLLINGARFSRQTLDMPDNGGYVLPSDELNLLIVTSRNVWSEDVAYRLLQRPLVNELDKSRFQIKYHILRPGTFQSFINHMDEVQAGHYHMIHFDVHGAVLSYEDLIKERDTGRMVFEPRAFGVKTFNPRPGFKDIPLFDGVMPFLFFEHDEEKNISPYSGPELAKKLAKWKVLMVTLNACQSAKALDTSIHKSLAQSLLNEGIQLVVAMRYSVSVSAAVIWVKNFFSNIAAKGLSVEKSASLASRALAIDKTRKAVKAYEIDLEDWMLPVVYANNEIRLNLKEWEEKSPPLKIFDKGLKPDYGFFGREHDILRVEKSILNHKTVAIYGMVGVGKTALLHELRRWWLHTKLFDQVVYIPLDKLSQEEETPQQYLLKSISSKEIKSELTTNEIQDQLLRLLGNPNIHYTIMLDGWGHKNADLPDQGIQELLNVLAMFKNTLVIFSARYKMPDTVLDTFDTYTWVELRPLDQTAAYELTTRILEKTNQDNENSQFNMRDFKENRPEQFDRFMELTKYFPSFLEEAIPKFKDQSLEELSKAYFSDYFF